MNKGRADTVRRVFDIMNGWLLKYRTCVCKEVDVVMVVSKVDGMNDNDNGYI